MDADAVLSALRDMAGQTEPKTKTKDQKVQEAAATVVPAPKVLTVDPVEDDDDDLLKENELPGMVPVVVLSDGTTFSDISGARIALVPPGVDDLPDGAYQSGVPISGLLDLYEAIRKVVR